MSLTSALCWGGRCGSFSVPMATRIAPFQECPTALLWVAGTPWTCLYLRTRNVSTWRQEGLSQLWLLRSKAYEAWRKMFPCVMKNILSPLLLMRELECEFSIHKGYKKKSILNIYKPQIFSSALGHHDHQSNSMQMLCARHETRKLSGACPQGAENIPSCILRETSSQWSGEACLSWSTRSKWRSCPIWALMSLSLATRMTVCRCDSSFSRRCRSFSSCSASSLCLTVRCQILLGPPAHSWRKCSIAIPRDHLKGRRSLIWIILFGQGVLHS